MGAWQHEEMQAAINRRVTEADAYRGGHAVPGHPRAPAGRRPARAGQPAPFLTATTWVEFRRSLDDEQAFHRLVSGIRGSSRAPAPAARPSRAHAPSAG